jgi:hypothetical protein
LLDPPGSSAPGHRQGGPGCQSRPGGVKARVHPQHGSRAQMRTRRDVAAAAKGGHGSRREWGGAACAQGARRNGEAHPQHRQVERGGKRRCGEEQQQRADGHHRGSSSGKGKGPVRARIERGVGGGVVRVSNQTEAHRRRRITAASGGGKRRRQERKG